MKILNLDNYISEKKSISPLTVKQIKNLNLQTGPDKLNRLPQDFADLNIKPMKPITKDKLEDGMIIKYKDGDYVIIIKQDNVKQAYGEVSDRYFNNEFIFVSSDAPGPYDLTYMGISDYDNADGYLRTNGVNPSGFCDIIEFYDSSLTPDLLKSPKDTKYVLKLIEDNMD